MILIGPDGGFPWAKWVVILVLSLPALPDSNAELVITADGYQLSAGEEPAGGRQNSPLCG
jgi:hypothetical protein